MKNAMQQDRAARLDALTDELEGPRLALMNHPLYARLDTLRAVRIFMESHVFAVWDFMTLLTSLQRGLTCTELPWVPKGTPRARRLINEIKLGEECDDTGTLVTSHFEMYVDAMRQAGADTSAIEETARVRPGVLPEFLYRIGAPVHAADFTAATWGLAFTGPLHAQAAAFAYGREDVIPEMFERVFALNAHEPRLRLFAEYLARHIELDGDVHGPLAREMVAELAGDDDKAWRECEDAARAALDQRVKLWDGTLAAIGV